MDISHFYDVLFVCLFFSLGEGLSRLVGLDWLDWVGLISLDWVDLVWVGWIGSIGLDQVGQIGLTRWG